DATTGEITFNGACRFFLDLRPSCFRYRCKLTVEVIHEAGSPLREPIRSDPSRVGAKGRVATLGVSEGTRSAGGASSAMFSKKVADGAKNRLPVLAKLKSSKRS